MLLKNQVIDFVSSPFEGRRLPPGTTDSSLVLIPKTPHPCSCSQLRPISLNNVCTKLILKIITGRIKPFLNNWISPFQSSFVLGSHIGDNMTLVQEIVHSMEAKHSRKHCMAIKLDLVKAFD